MLTLQVLNTKGAARRLGCSETWIHKLAATGKLKAYIYGDEGNSLSTKKRPRSRAEHSIFAARDVAQYRPAVQRRPRGSKNKSPCSENQQKESEYDPTEKPREGQKPRRRQVFLTLLTRGGDRNARRSRVSHVCSVPFDSQCFSCSKRRSRGFPVGSYSDPLSF